MKAIDKIVRALRAVSPMTVDQIATATGLPGGTVREAISADTSKAGNVSVRCAGFTAARPREALWAVSRGDMPAPSGPGPQPVYERPTLTGYGKALAYRGQVPRTFVSALGARN